MSKRFPFGFRWMKDTLSVFSFARFEENRLERPLDEENPVGGSRADDADVHGGAVEHGKIISFSRSRFFLNTFS